VITFITPKNSGLKKCKEIAKHYLNSNSKIVEVRGEDVPSFVEKFSKEGKKVIGITGEDFFKEFILETRSKLNILKRIKWNDKRTLFGKPTLCLLGPKNKKLEDLPKNLRVCINRKYIKLSKKFLGLLENKGYNFEKIYLSGSTEESFANNLADIVIDIVYSGRSAEKAGLKVYEKIFESDIIIIGMKEEFTLNDLYRKISNRIFETSEFSYTRKISQDEPRLLRKIIEESGEVITAKNNKDLIWEAADLIYFLFVLLAKKGITIKDIEKENLRRNKETLLNQEKLKRQRDTLK